MTARPRLALLATAVVAVGGLGAAATATAAPAGPPSPAVSFFDGPASPEDLVTLPGTDTVLASGLAADPLSDASVGHLYAIDSRTREATEIWPDSTWGVDHDRALYGDCPGPPDPSLASPHGIAAERGEGGTFDVYVVNHGGREAIEVFTLDPRADSLTWRGCVEMPAGTFANGVAPLPQGDGLVATDFFDPTLSDPFSQIFSDTATGSLQRWEPGTGWSTVPGSSTFGPNGVVVSQDGSNAYVAEWGRNRIHRIPLEGSRPGTTSPVADVDLMPDNLRWSRSGELLVTGQDFTVADVQACQRDDLANCPTGLDVYAMDPRTMDVRTVWSGDPAGFRAPTVATQVGGELWVGAVKGARIGVVAPFAGRSR
ncbi:MAG: hypothetical protein C0493_03575 [Kytococcus sp.]|nr:hypothetical protein [Kytococcus sp.]